MTLTESSPQSTFPEYFYVINTIKKTFTRDRTHFTNLRLLLVLILLFTIPRVGFVLVNKENEQIYSGEYSHRSESEFSSEESSKEDGGCDLEETDAKEIEVIFSEKFSLKGSAYHSNFQHALEKCHQQHVNGKEFEITLQFSK